VAQTELTALPPEAAAPLAQELMRIVDKGTTNPSPAAHHQAMFAAVALGKMGSAAHFAIPGLVEILALPSAYAELQGGAAAALITLSPASVPALRQALSDPRARLRFLAANAIGRIRPPATEAIASLEPLFNDPDREVQAQAKGALGQMGAEGLNVLRAANGQTTTPYAELIQGKDAVTQPRDITEWNARLADADPKIRANACEALSISQIPAEQSASLIGRLALSDPSRDVRESAVRALQNLLGAAPSALNLVISALRDSEAPVRVTAVTVLSTRAPVPEQATPELSALLERYIAASSSGPVMPDYSVDLAARLLGSNPDPQIQSLVEKVKAINSAKSASDRAAWSQYGRGLREDNLGEDRRVDDERKKMLYTLPVYVLLALGIYILMRFAFGYYRRRRP